MNIVTNKLKIRLLFFIVCVVICSIQTGYAFEPCKGEVLTNVNLRKAPALDGKIIAGLEKGDKVIIKNELNGWYQILLDTKAFGYKGWIYGQYIKKAQINNESKTFPLKGEIIETPIGPPLSKTPINHPVVRQTEINQSVNPETVKASSEKEQPKTAIIKKINIDPQPEAETEVKNIIPARNDFAQPEKIDVKKPLTASNTENPVQYQNGKSLIRFVLSLSSMILSCLALLLSYKAFQLVNNSHNKSYAVSTESPKNIYLGKLL